MTLTLACMFSSCESDDSPLVPPEKSPFQIEFSGYDRPSDLMVSITPEDKEMTYYTTIDTKAYYHPSETTQSPEEILQRDILYEISLYCEHFGNTVEEALAKMCKRGNGTLRRNNLIADTEYAILAAGVDKTGKIVTEVVIKPFVTKAVSPSSNSFTITLGEIGTTHVTADVTADNDDLYYMTCVPQEGYLSDEQFLKEVTGGDLSPYLKHGNTSGFKKEGLLPDTEYYFLVFGFEAGYPTTTMTKKAFRTRSNASAEMSFEFVLDNVEAGYTEITVRPTPTDATYYADCVPADADAAFVKKYMEEQIQGQIAMGIIKDAAGFYKITSLTGEDFITYYDAELGKSYKPFAFGVNTDTGEVTTEIIFGEPFTVEK